MKPVDNGRIQRMMHELGRALHEAVSTSTAVNDVVRKIRREGYSLYLVLDSDPASDRRGPQIELTSQAKREGTPAFRLDGNDVAFLRSVGIDPTRSARRRRNHNT